MLLSWVNLLFTLATVPSGLAFVHEVNKRSLKQFLSGKFFTLTYVDSTGCSRCRNLYPYFVAASQAFPKDPEIFFARTFDKELIKKWNVDELPALVYHWDGVDDPMFASVDITVDDLVNEIARLVGGSFENTERLYSVDLNSNNYDEIMITPKQAAMILVYNKYTRESFEVLEKVAYAFRKDDAILFGSINVDKHKDLRDARFMTRDVPSFMWLSGQDKTKPKRFGGMQTKHLLTTFINEQTSLHRNVDGALNPEAGRIPSIDDLLTDHADLIYDLDPDQLNLLTLEINKMRNSVQPHLIDMLDYYIFVLDHLGTEGTTRALDILSRDLDTKILEDEDLPTKKAEAMKRQLKVVQFFKHLMRQYAKGQWKAGSGVRVDETRVNFDPKHHVHTEL